MDTLESFALTTISSAGASAALMATLIWLLRNWIGERLQAGIRHEYDDRLEKLRAELRAQGDAQLASLKSELDRQSEKMRIASASFSEVQKATIARKIEAVDALWKGVVEARDAFPSDAGLTDVLYDKELARVYIDQGFAKLADRLRKLDHFAFFQAGFKEVQAVRPHLGEYTWAVYSTYRALLTRALYLISEAGEVPSKVVWFEDQIVLDFVRSALGPEKKEEFAGLGSARFKWLHQNFDTLLFTAIDTLLTGQNFSDAALKQAERMEQMIYAAGIPKKL
jgi:hypothetical protein